jgi:hypothetical protein
MFVSLSHEGFGRTLDFRLFYEMVNISQDDELLSWQVTLLTHCPQTKFWGRVAALTISAIAALFASTIANAVTKPSAPSQQVFRQLCARNIR